MMMIELKHSGKRLLVQSSQLVIENKYAPIMEFMVLEVSPSGDFFKYKNMSPSSATYEYWVPSDTFIIVEELG